MEILAGNSDFKAVRERGNYYIDKTQLIAEVLRSQAMVMLITRPRRFGKTLNLSMLHSFFQLEANQGPLFAGLAIERDADAMKHMGAYPTLFLSFKDLNCLSWDDCQIKIKDMLASLFLKHKKWIDKANPQFREKRDVEDILNGTAPLAICENALQLLTRLLHRATDKRVMVLIDEYDTPINAGQTHQYYDQIVAFTRNLMNAGLKDNICLERGVLTGILRVAKESIFSGMNNVRSFTLLSTDFSTHFGFSQAEVEKVLEDFKLSERKKDVAEWYNGYRIGDQWLYNPWSIMSMASNKGKLELYWVNTSNNDLIKKLITWDRSLASGDLECLLRGQAIARNISDAVALRDISPDDVWSLLFFSGYLTFSQLSPDPGSAFELTIPNLEVRQFFEDTVKRWLGPIENWQVIREAMDRVDMPALEKHLSAYFMKTMSFYDVGGPQTHQAAKNATSAHTSESFYHAVMLGMLIYQQDRYDISSNRESGHGRYDLALVPKQANGTAYIFELKQTTVARLEREATSAVQQIKANEYWTSLPNRENTQCIMMVGLAFSGKRMAMAFERLASSEPVGGRRSFNPFQPAGADRFVGRAEPLQQLTSALNRGDSVSLVGDWRMGKSSLLAAFYHQQQALGTVHLLSGEGAESASLGCFVAAITGREPDEVEEPDQAANVLADWARQVTVAGQAPLLLVDDFEGVALRFDLRFFERLRGMLDRVRLVVSTRRPLELIYEQANLTSPFYNRLELVTLGLLSQDEITALIDRLGAGLKPSARTLLLQQAGGHPYYLNLLGKYLLESDQAQALDRFQLSAKSSLGDLWRQLKAKEKKDLLATLKGTPCMGVSYRARGLVTAEGMPFGQVFRTFLEDQA